MSLNLSLNISLFQEPHQNIDYWCSCSVCKKLESIKGIRLSDSSRTEERDDISFLRPKLERLGAHQISYSELVQKFVSGEDSVKGAPIRLTEMIIFEGKKAKCVIRYEETTEEVKKVDSPAALHLHNLMKYMVHAFRKRGARIIMKEKQKNSSSLPLVKQNRKSKSIVVIKLRSQDSLRFVNETDFMEFMMERPGSKQWPDTDYVQNYLLVSAPIPKTIRIPFVPSEDSKGNIIFSLAQFESDDEIKKRDPNQLGQKICNSLGLYLQRVHGIDLLYMKATFLEDDKGNLWLFNAEHIYFRQNEIMKSRIESELKANQAMEKQELLKNKIDKESLIQSIEILIPNKHLSEAMHNDYDSMKSIIGIDKVSEKQKDRSSNIYRELQY